MVSLGASGAGSAGQRMADAPRGTVLGVTCPLKHTQTLEAQSPLRRKDPETLSQKHQDPDGSLSTVKTASTSRVCSKQRGVYLK